MSKKKEDKYRVIKDSREKDGHGWIFNESDYCDGTTVSALKTGDYSMEGFQDIFTIERKATTSELANNIWEKRFEEELKRLEEFKYPYMIFEFTMDDVLNYPVNSGIPVRFWGKLKSNNKIILSTINRYLVQYKTQIIFAGKHGKTVAEGLFKSMMRYGEK